MGTHRDRLGNLSRLLRTRMKLDDTRLRTSSHKLHDYSAERGYFDDLVSQP